MGHVDTAFLVRAEERNGPFESPRAPTCLMTVQTHDIMYSTGQSYCVGR